MHASPAQAASRATTPAGRQTEDSLLEALAVLRRRLHWLRWLRPAGLAALVIAYELGPAHWIHTRLGDNWYFVAEIVVYGTFGPGLAWLLLHFLDRWLEERETTEVQAGVLAQAREQARVNHDLTDAALQTLFALSLHLDTLQTNVPDLEPATAARFAQTKQAVGDAIQKLYANTSRMHES